MFIQIILIVERDVDSENGFEDVNSLLLMLESRRDVLRFLLRILAPDGWSRKILVDSMLGGDTVHEQRSKHSEQEKHISRDSNKEFIETKHDTF